MPSESENKRKPRRYRSRRRKSLLRRHRVALPVAGILLYGCLVAAVASPSSFSFSWLTTALQPTTPVSPIAGNGRDAHTGRAGTATPGGSASSATARLDENVAALDSAVTATVQTAEAVPERLVVHEQIPAPALSYRVSSDASYASTDGADQSSGEQMPLPGSGDGGGGSFPTQPTLLAGSPGGTLYPNTPPGTTPFALVPYSGTPSGPSPGGGGGTPIAKTTTQDPPPTDPDTPPEDLTDPTGEDSDDPPIQIVENPPSDPTGGDTGNDGPPNLTDPPLTDPVDVPQQIVQVPEPSTLLLMLPAMLALLLLRRRRPAYARATRP